MEQYIVSARKYRPPTFYSVVGQQAVTNTLKNAIKNNQLAQAFLFCGPRGVGKTTCARILAKAVNADDIDNVDGEQIDEFNVIELDAASNNSVDDIRNLIDQVRIPPAAGQKYKTYIIDEVHMLSTAAFNAFLKTLEEPPSYAIFILATTEKHKILPTILSRCQIFDFQRIKIQDMVNHLSSIAKKENIHAEPDALHIIAQKADGGLRDALSMFDQLATFTGRNLTYTSVIENLNVLDYDYYFTVTDALIEQNIPKALLTFSEILENGFDGQHFLLGLGEHLRNLLVCKDAVTLSLLEVGENIRQRYAQQAQSVSLDLLIRGLNKINEADINYRQSKNQKLLVELTLMQLCSLQYQEGEKKNDIKLIPPSVYNLVSKPVIAVAEKSKPVEVQVTQESKTVSSPSIESQIPPKAAAPVATKPLGQKASLGISIKGIVAKKVDTTEETAVSSKAENQPKDDFSQHQLEACWKTYAEQVRNKQRESFYSTLIIRQPQLLDDFEIKYFIDNAVQRRDFEQNQSDMLEFMRKTLNNYSIRLTLEVIKVQEKTNFYTDGDKLQAMAEKNPVVKDLVKRLGLDTEF